jgi:hypothetical protein
MEPPEEISTAYEHFLQVVLNGLLNTDTWPKKELKLDPPLITTDEIDVIWKSLT